VNGELAQLELLGYHIPNAEICLLSSQVLTKTIDGHTLQTANAINVILDNGNYFSAQFCPQSNLPMIPLALGNKRKHCFWNKALGFQLTVSATSMPLNLSCINPMQIFWPQKELRLWHQ
jgi:hypothetical protein